MSDHIYSNGCQYQENEILKRIHFRLQEARFKMKDNLHNVRLIIFSNLFLFRGFSIQLRCPSIIFFLCSDTFILSGFGYRSILVVYVFSFHYCIYLKEFSPNFSSA